MPQTAECIMYCRPWCADCRRARIWLTRKGYDYTEVDIDTDEDARARCVEIAGKVVTPTFEIGSKTIVDFDPEALEAALGERPGRTRTET